METSSVQPSITTPPQTTNASASPKKLPLMIAGAVLVLGLVGAIYFMTTTQNKTTDDTPPSLTTESGLKGSFVESKYGFLEFEEKDITAFQQTEKELTAKSTPQSLLKSGVNYVYAEENLTAKQIAGLIDPASKKALIAYYNPGEGSKEKKFYTYPEGKFSGTGLLEENEVIPANRGFIIIIEKSAKAYKIRTSDTQPAATASLIGPDIAGWVLTTISSSSTAKELSPYKNRLEIAWGFVTGIPQIKIDTAKLETADPSKEYLVWLKLKLGKNEAPAQETPSPEKAPVIEKVEPSAILIPEPNETPELVPQTKVQLTGTNLKTVESVTFEDKNITATIKPIANYLAEMQLSISPTTVSSVKGFTVKTASGKEAAGVLIVAHKDPILAPKVTKTDIVEIDPNKPNDHYINITGENLISYAIEKIIFKDTNIQGSKQSFASSKEFSLQIKFDPSKIQPGLKPFSIMANGNVYESETPIPFVKKSESKFEYPTVDFTSHKQHTLGEPWKKLHVYGTNLNKIMSNYLAVEKYGLLKPLIELINDNHLTIVPQSVPIDIETSDTVLILRYMTAQGDLAKDASGQLYINVPFTFSASSKAPTISINEVSPQQISTGDTTEITMSGMNIDDDTKVSIVKSKKIVPEKTAKVTMKEITSSKDGAKGKITIEITASDEAEGVYELKVMNLFGTTYIPLTIYTKPLAT